MKLNIENIVMIITKNLVKKKIPLVVDMSLKK